MRHIPNALTLLNVLAGALACFYAAQGSYPLAAWLVLIGGGVDVLDGLAARALKAYSPTGKVLDSLADLLTFGTAPALALAHWSTQWPVGTGSEGLLYLAAAFVLPPAAALRLAQFTATQEPELPGYFRGLPTPAVGLGLIALPLWLLPSAVGGTFWLLPLVLAVLMNSRLPFLSLKTGGFHPRQHWPQVALAAALAVLVLLTGWRAGLYGLAFYTALSLVAGFLRSKPLRKA